MEIIIEEISRNHKLISRHKLSKPLVSIGRGYQSDVILSDPHICAEHLHISFDGEQWLATDQDTVNGSYFHESKKCQKQQTIKSGDIISIGKSLIRIIFPNHPVAETIRFSAFESFTNIIRKPWLILVNVIIFSLVSAYGVHLDAGKELSITQILVPTIGMTFVFSLWPFLVGLVSHLTKHDARIVTQLGICFVFYNAMWLYDLLANVASFNSSSHFSLFDIFGILPAIMVFSLLWFNCYIGFHFSKVKRLIIAGSLTLLLFGGSALVAISKTPEFSSKAQYNSTLMTPSFLFNESKNVDEFISDNKRLFDKVREEAQQEK